jgi:hypothetical protein
MRIVAFPISCVLLVAASISAQETASIGISKASAIAPMLSPAGTGALAIENPAATMTLERHDLSGVVSQAQTAPASDQPPSQPPSSWKISLTGDTLKSFNHVAIAVHNVHTNADESYSGVPLSDLLARQGVPVGKDLHGKALANYIVATGSDGYKVVLALAEIDPALHPGQVIVADTLNDKPLDKDGPFKLIVTEDKRPARWVRNLVSLEVKQAE